MEEVKEELPKEVEKKSKTKLIAVWKLGTSDKPSSDEEIEKFKSDLDEFYKKYNINLATFVTHHAVELSLFEIK